jgi:NIMA (never in mitosis gene a)-related kinase
MSEEERKTALKEAKILEKVNHPNIIKFREVYKTKKGNLCIVMDFADGDIW